MHRLRPDCPLVPLLLIAGMVMHGALPGLGLRTATCQAELVAAGQTTPCGMGSMRQCGKQSEARRCCRALEQAVAQSSCCMTRQRCAAPPPPCEPEPEPEAQQEPCTLERCPVTRWVVILDKTGLDSVAALHLRRVDLDVMMPTDPVVQDWPPPIPLRLAARLAQHGAWLT